MIRKLDANDIENFKAVYMRGGDPTRFGATEAVATDIACLLATIDAHDEEIAQLRAQREEYLQRAFHADGTGPGPRVERLEEALRNVALQCGSYMCEGDDGPVIHCLYCGGENDDPCIACQINTMLDEKEYVGKGAKCDRDYLVRKGWRDDEPSTAT